MNMVHKYEEFCQLYDQGRVKPDVRSPEGYDSVQFLRNHGWKIGRWRKSKDLLSICRQSEANFKFAHKDAGIDFWKQR